MEYKNNQLDKYLKLLIRLGKQFSPFDGFLIIIRSHLTNNIYYYFFCVVFRALFLIMISGNYMYPFLHINSQVIQDSTKILSLNYLFENLSVTYFHYLKLCSVLYILLVIRMILLAYTLNQFSKSKYSKNFPTPFKYQIIMDHIIFLFFPFLLEFLSIPYYIYFLGDKFIIKLEYSVDKNELLALMVINTILIILYNFQNNVHMMCANKNYTSNDSEAILGTQNEKSFENSYVSYRDSNLTFICFTVVQNVPLIKNIENYIGDNTVKYYKFSVTLIFVLLFIILIREKLYLFNYVNLINNLVAILMIFCFYSIILDIIFYLSKYEFKNWLNELIYIIEKLLLAFISNLLIVYRCHKYLEKQIINILFQDKNVKKKDNFINAFLYLNQIMIQIKEKNDHNQNVLLINFLNHHIVKCSKADCNCKLLSSILRKDSTENRSLREKNYTSNLLKVLNYLYESPFVEFDYYNKYDLTILLAEHYCHLVNNPTMAFSLIISLLIRQKNKLLRIQKIVLYELCEKYIYSIFSKIRIDDENEESLKDENLLMNKQKFDYFQNYFMILKSSYYTKILMNQYINNLIKILRYKSIFEDTLTINYDEGNEIITNVQINFFNLNSNIKSNFNESNKKKKKNLYDKKSNYNSDDTSNIYKVIKILKKEQIYNKNIINSIKNIDIFKDIPIFIIYKYYLFFDIFNDGEIPIEIFQKLNLFLSRYRTLYNNRISDGTYVLLKRLYALQNNKSDSKFFGIFVFKKEIKTKYFDECLSLKLGYKQKEIINEKLDELLPKEFSYCHLNIVKRIFLGEQKRFFKSQNSFIFDVSHTVMNSIDAHGIMIYNLSNNLIMILEIKLIDEKDYIFMLNHNFDLIANTRNFTEDYLLNQKIFNKYKLKLLEMLKTKPEKINQKFSDIFKSIDQQKEYRQIKTDEYFVPQLYVPLGEKSSGMLQINNFNMKKNKILLKITNSNNDIGNNKINMGSILEDNEQEKLLKNERTKDEIFEQLLNNYKVVFHSNYSFSLNKMKFVENIAKELTKILDNELTTDNNNEQNLVIGSKRLISDLLMRNELLNNSLNIDIRMSYYYDRPFYFIRINDEKKILFKINKYITGNNTSRKINRNLSPSHNYLLQCSSKFGNKSRSQSNLRKEPENVNNSDINSVNSSLYYDSQKKIIPAFMGIKLKEGGEMSHTLSKKEVIEKIDKYRYMINRDKFILIIKLLLFIIITGILIIYILNMIIQRNSINLIEKILLTYYYNSETKNAIINVFSKLLDYFIDNCGLISNTTASPASSYKTMIINYSNELRENLHNFKKYYIEYNLEMGNSFQIIYDNKNFYKLRGRWREILYDSDYCSELDFIIHSLFLIESENLDDIIKDIDIFMFYRNSTDRGNKISTSFIKLIFYFSVNYEFTYKSLYDEINSDIYSSYSSNSYRGTVINYILEIGSLILYLLFFISCFIYLYYSNLIIVKNIIFLFLDFSQDPEDRGTNSNNISDIIGKLLKLQNLINDFNLNNVKIYSDYLDKKNNPEISNDNISDTKISIKRSKNLDNNNKKKNDINNSQANDIRSKKTNNSSQNFLLRSNSRLVPERINSKKMKRDIVPNNNGNSSLKFVNFKNLLNSPSPQSNSPNSIQLKKTIIKSVNARFTGRPAIHINNSITDETNLKDNYEDAVLDRSNKITIYIIKIHSVIIIFFLVVIIAYSIYKLRNNTIFIEEYERFYSDFHIVEERYSSLYYYFNVMKTIIIFSDKEERSRNMSIIMENLNSNYEKMTNNYNQLLSKRMNFYNEVKELFEIFTYNKNDSIEYLQKNICMNDTKCINYLTTNDSIFNSGIDFGYKICFSYLHNIFMDYQSIKNKTNIEEIKNTITGDKFYEFKRLRKSFTNTFYFLKVKLFKNFKTEAVSFGSRYKRVVLTLNFISLLISVLVLLFVIIFIFITVSSFSTPIKDSTYRINLSLYYIKNYSLTKERKRDSSYFLFKR